MIKKEPCVDEVVSLGYNCEIAFRISNYLGKLSSQPFSWAYVEKRELFVKALEEIDSLFTGSVSVADKDIVEGMIQCDRYEIAFHPRGEYVSPNGDVYTETFSEAVLELRSRVGHLVNNFKALLKSEHCSC